MLRLRQLLVALAPAAVLVPALAAGLSAQSPPAAAPALSPRAAGYASFAVGKWADLQAQQAQGARQTQLYTQALSDYRAALKADPGSIYVTGQIADLLARMGRDQDALDLAQTTAQKQPSSVAAQTMLAGVYLDELSDAPQPLTPAGIDLLNGAVTVYQRLIQLAPGDAGNHVMLGRLYGADGKPAQAESEFRAALAITPGDREAVASLVQSLAGQGKLDEAARIVAALPPASQNPQADAILGEAFRSHQMYDKAAAAFRLAIQAEPDDPALQSALAQSLLDAGDYDDALVEFQKLEKQDPSDGRAALRVAQTEMQLGQFASAAVSLKRAGQLLSPDNIEVAYAQALLDQSQGDISGAVSGLRALAARKTSPQTQSIFLDQLARLEMQQGNEAGAAGDLQQLQALGGNYAARAQALEVELYTRNRDYPQALSVLRDELQASPDSRSLRLTYAGLLGQAGQTSQALAALQPLSNGASAWDVVLAQSRIQADAGDWSSAAASARRAQSLATTPVQRASAVAELGAIQSTQHRWKDAEKSLRAALALDPANPDALSRLGFVLAQRGHHLNQALGDAERAVAHDANNGDYLDCLGSVYLKMGRTADAVATLQKASRLQRNDPVILDHLAQAYARSGDWSQAAQNWRAALDQLKSSPLAQSNSDQVRAIRKELDHVPAAARNSAD